MGDFVAVNNGLVRTAPETAIPCPPNVLRWNPVPLPNQQTDFVDGIVTIATNGDAKAQLGIGIQTI